MKYITSLKYKHACDIIWICLCNANGEYISIFLDDGDIISRTDNIDKDKNIAELLETGFWEYHDPFPEITFTRPEHEGGTSTLSADRLKEIIEINIDKKE
jgi:hypothetical protein